MIYLEEEQTWGGYDFSKPSRAVIATDGKWHGSLIWAVGGHLRMEMDECGNRRLEDLGLDEELEAGIWIWEGKYFYDGGTYECSDDGAMVPEGTFRRPTEAEWEKIQRHECPWNDEDWKLGT